MSSLMKANFADSQDVRTPDKTRMAVVELNGQMASQLRLQPGWKWSECIKPLAGTESCQKSHVGFIQQGQLHVISVDGSELDVKAGDFYVFGPGHDGWVVGDEEVIAYEFESSTAATYAKG
jgi:hypothetical protein